ncbi:MAG TPA: TrbI/VirB10 family protein [Candidatus Acidoferrales bacterium]|nr:TrbI/VirB10 family protein [Candidatus Acidoferrales bacterium]
MTDQNTAPAAQPIQEKAPKPPGLMPKNIQAWVMLGLAVLMVLIMWLTGGKKKPQNTPKSNVSTFQPAAQPEINEAQIAALQNRIQELQREQQTAIKQQNKFFGSLPSEAQTSTPAQVSGPTPEPGQPDPVQEEKKRRAYVSLFSSNVALSYRKEFAQPERSSPNGQAPNEVPGLPSTDQQSDINQLAQILAQVPLPTPQPGIPAAVPQPGHRQPTTTTGEKEEKTPTSGSTNSNRLAAATGKTYVLFEGSILETVLLNRLSGDFNGPVECLVTIDVYSHDRQHLLIPSGTKVLGEAKRVEAFGQTRLAVAFHRLIMPDGYSVSLDQFKGMNQIGDTGLRDKVNNHYFKIFGASLAVGAIGGIAEAGSGGVLTQSGAQSIQQGVGESMGQTSQRILDKFLNILPTVTIREGHRVKIYLSGDLDLPDYANHKMPSDL